jgi:hypothetical protein
MNTLLTTTRERIFSFDCLRRVHTPAPWGETKGMYPESNTLPEHQPRPLCLPRVSGFLGWLIFSKGNLKNWKTIFLEYSTIKLKLPKWRSPIIVAPLWKLKQNSNF